MRSGLIRLPLEEVNRRRGDLQMVSPVVCEPGRHQFKRRKTFGAGSRGVLVRVRDQTPIVAPVVCHIPVRDAFPSLG